jgi:hypothetical protein
MAGIAEGQLVRLQASIHPCRNAITTRQASSTDPCSEDNIMDRHKDSDAAMMESLKWTLMQPNHVCFAPSMFTLLLNIIHSHGDIHGLLLSLAKEVIQLNDQRQCCQQ